MKKLLCLSISLIFAASALFSGCGGKQDGGNPGSGDKSPTNIKKDIKLRIAWWGSQDRHNDTLKVLDMYREKHPNITFEPEYAGIESYYERLSAQVAANNMPDIVNHDYRYFELYVNRGTVLTLDDYVSKGSLNLNGVDKATVDVGRVDGKLYAINLGVNTQALMYDPEMFNRAGAPLPNENWDWDDFINACMKFKKNLNVFGAGCMPGDYFHGFRYYLRQNGKTMYSKDRKTLGYEDDKLFVEFFGMDLMLTKAGALPMPYQRLEIRNNHADMLVTGKAAMSGYAKNSNNLSDVQLVTNKPLKLAILPKAKNEVQYGLYIKPSMFFTVSKTSKYPDESVDFVNYFIRDIDANKILKTNRGITMIPEVRDALRLIVSEKELMQFDYIDKAVKISSPIEPPEPSGQLEVEKVMQTIEQEILYEQITLEEGARRFRKEAEAILLKAK